MCQQAIIFTKSKRYTLEERLQAHPQDIIIIFAGETAVKHRKQSVKHAQPFASSELNLCVTQGCGIKVRARNPSDTILMIPTLKVRTNLGFLGGMVLISSFKSLSLSACMTCSEPADDPRIAMTCCAMPEMPASFHHRCYGVQALPDPHAFRLMTPIAATR